MALCFTELELWPLEVLHCGNRDFRPFSSSDLDPYSLEIYHLCKYKLPTCHGFWKLSFDRQTRPEYATLLFLSKSNKTKRT